MCGLRSRDGRLPDDVQPQLGESGWLGAIGEHSLPRPASAGNLLRARGRAGLRSFRRSHQGPWNTRQFSRRGPHGNSYVGRREERETRLPARPDGREPAIIFFPGCRSRVALAWLPLRAKARCLRIALRPTIHEEARRPGAVARSVQSVGQRSSRSVGRGANLAGHASRRAAD